MYEALNEAVLEQVPRAARSVLDVGCGAGLMGEWLQRHRGCNVTGVTHSLEEGERAKARLQAVIVADVNDATVWRGLGPFDCIVCSHVLEHLVEPGTVLRRLRGLLTSPGTLVVALPNVLFWRQRLALVRGRFAYTDGGLMDRTHLRFFDWQTARELVEDAGYRVEHRAATGSVPGSRLLGRALARRVDRTGLTRAPGLFGFQFVVRARPAPFAEP